MQQTPFQRRVARCGCLLAVLLAGASLAWADSGTNRVPLAESFEDVAPGFVIDQASGWTAETWGPLEAGRVTTNPVAIAALTNYVAGGGTLPLDTNHAQVLALGGVIAQQAAGPAGRLVQTDCLIMPWLNDDRRPLVPVPQFAICFDGGGLASIFHRNTLAGTNEWLRLERATPVSSQSWVRVTVLMDYASHMFQVSLNAGAPISANAGWTGPGGGTNGTWFFMAASNDAMASVRFYGDGTAFLDDLAILSDLPTVQTLPASNVTATTVELPGYLSFTGLAATSVEVYWGTTDGGTNAAAWANTNIWAAPQAPGFRAHMAAASNAVVYYRFAATNAYGRAWAESSEAVVAGAINLDLNADNQADERPVETGTFRIERPSWSTNVALTVCYQMSGTASNGVDYDTLPGSVVMPAGATTFDLVLTPLPDGIVEAPTETAILTLQPGAYRVGSSATAQVTIEDAAPLAITWLNTSGDRCWNSTSTNWNAEDELFFPNDRVTFTEVPGTTGRLYVGQATWVPAAGRWTNAIPAAVQAGAMTVSGGQYEFEGGAVLGGPVAIQGGRVIDRELTRTGFGGGLITLSGGGEFWRQLPPDTNAVLQLFTNALTVAGNGGTLQGGRGANEWRGHVDLQSRLSIGFTNTVVGHVNRFTGMLVVNQDTNNTAARVVALRAGGGQAYLDGPIVDDPDTNHLGNVPLVLESAARADVLTLRGTNTYAGGTVVTNAGGTNGVVVAAGSSLGRGWVVVAGTGAWLRVQGAGGIQAPLTVGSNATVTLEANGAVTGTTNAVTVVDGGLLVLQSGDCLPDGGALVLGASGRVRIGAGLEEAVGDLFINTMRLPGGLYTAVNQPANILGAGAIRVRGLAPTGVLLLVR